MIKYTLYIPAGCFYTQLKVFIGVKSTMNCNPSCPAATLLASLDCAYLYWPPPHRLLACFMSLSTFSLLDSDFWWTGEWQRVFYRKAVSRCAKYYITEVVSLILPCYVCAFSYKFTSWCHVMFHSHISDVVLGSESESEFSGLSAAQTKWLEALATELLQS